MHTPPSWLQGSSLVWSSVPAHHQRYNEAKVDALSIPGELASLGKEIAAHEDDLSALGAALNAAPKDAVIRLRYEDKERHRHHALGRHTHRSQRLTQATRTVEHFESSLEQAWARLFGEEAPPSSSALETWDDSAGGVYHLHAKGRVVFRGKYDGILIPSDEQPEI